MGKRELYTKGDAIHNTIPKHRILKMENNVQNKETNIRRILNNIRMLFQGYLTFKKEETNDSSARHTTVLYSEVLYSAVLAVWDG